MSKVNQTFWDRFARIYALFMKRNESAYDAIAEQIKPVLTSEMRALELACGTAQMTRRLSGNVREWIATDYAPNMVAAAQKHFSAANVSYQVADATALPFPDSAFDAVIIANALHIMPEPEAALAEIRRVLKAGGLLVAPTFVYEPGYSRFPIWIAEKAGFRTFHKWTAAELAAFVQAYGYQVERAQFVKDCPLYECILVARENGHDGP